jgi:RNA polymerase sigma-70 factor (ECF subfamily)
LLNKFPSLACLEDGQHTKNDGNGVRIGPEEVRRLYEKHGRALLAYACSFVSDYSAAEDVLHQVFVRLLRGDIEITGPPVAYLYRAIRNAALNTLRRHSREVELDSNAGWLESPPGMEEMGVALQSVLRNLPEEQREIIVLRVWGQMSFEEAAAVVGISPSTAASRYRYGLMKLRERLRPSQKE